MTAKAASLSSKLVPPPIRSAWTPASRSTPDKAADALEKTPGLHRKSSSLRSSMRQSKRPAVRERLSENGSLVAGMEREQSEGGVPGQAEHPDSPGGRIIFREGGCSREGQGINGCHVILTTRNTNRCSLRRLPKISKIMNIF